MLRLSNPLRDYPWGSTSLLQDLLGRPQDGKPLAELWSGAHPGDPSLVLEQGDTTRLDDVIGDDPHRVLGARVVSQYGAQLPFLAKFIAAAKPLSIQVHPTASQAAEGFAAENSRNIPLAARDRRYKDDNPKPELLVAIQPFTALAGLRQPADLLAELHRVTDLDVSVFVKHVSVSLQERTWQPALEWALTSGSEQVDIPALCKALTTLDVPPNSPINALSYLSEHFPGDRGILVALMMHRVELSPGQGLYVPAGLLHTYLSGLGLEVMAASDNVLRAGLTSKHMDVPELLRLVNATPDDTPPMATPQSTTDGMLWTSPDGYFELLQVRPGSGPEDHRMVAATGPRIALVTAGNVSVYCDGARQDLRCGNAVFLPDNSGPVSLNGSGSVALIGVPNFAAE